MKLKTVKDFECAICGGKKCHKDSRAINQKELKAEAIKWVKNEREYHNKFRDARANVLMEFHNITEEDLK